MSTKFCQDYLWKMTAKVVDESFIKYLKELRFGTMEIKEPKYKRKLEVVAVAKTQKKLKRVLQRRS